MSETATQQPFQAEVKQLLDIVIHSLYTDKEIFVRELVSNASDALEKLRLKQATSQAYYQADKELEIHITTDEENNTLTIQDFGIGMTREELQTNLGTIAHSGTKAFLQQLKEKGETNNDVIGQFGVGFYSAFMAGDKVDVYTHSFDESAESLKWSSDGATGYTIDEVTADEAARGCRMVIHLTEENKEFAENDRIKSILEKYSNFVSFPILLNGERINTVEAIWLKGKSEVSEEQYEEFYKFVAHAYDQPMSTFHFNADAPLNINSVLFVPGSNPEQFGMGQTEPGVSLYCRKVLIEDKPKKLLPEWLRFLRGVVDSEDLPLNISRETMQDSQLFQKLGKTITNRFLKHLEREAKRDEEKHLEFFKMFGRFLKEGIATSFDHKDQLAGLLRFESSLTEAGQFTNFSEYIDRAKEDQDKIYYLVGESRAALEASPYLEAFKARNLEVIFFTDPVDNYLFDMLRDYKEKELVSAAKSDLELDDLAEDADKLSDNESADLTSWLKDRVSDQVNEVKVGKRLVDSPIVALLPADAPNAQMREMFKAMGQEVPDAKVDLEINPSHDLIKQLNGIKGEKPELADAVAKQLTGNALLAAGLVENPQAFVSELNNTLGDLLKNS